MGDAAFIRENPILESRVHANVPGPPSGGASSWTSTATLGWPAYLIATPALCPPRVFSREGSVNPLPGHVIRIGNDVLALGSNVAE